MNHFIQKGSQPIHVAVSEGKLEVVKYLIDDLKINPRTQLKVRISFPLFFFY